MELLFETGTSDESFAVIQLSRAGVERGRADEVARRLGLTDKEMAPILNISERTFHRLRPETLLDHNASERLLLLEGLVHHGLEVFDGRAEVLGRWLRVPLPELRRQAPLMLLDTATGFGMVHTVLGRIEHGLYA